MSGKLIQVQKTKKSEEKKPKKNTPNLNDLPTPTGEKIKGKRGRKRKAFGVLEERKRKRVNRENSNRNDYGNEGFCLFVLYLYGFSIKFEKISNTCCNQKLKILSVDFVGKNYLNRSDIDASIDTSLLFPEGVQNAKRIKRIMVIRKVDNRLIDIIINDLGLEAHADVKKKNEKDYMPERYVMETINFYRHLTKKQIVDIGCIFYDTIKYYCHGRENYELKLNDDMNGIFDGEQLIANFLSYAEVMNSQIKERQDQDIPLSNVQQTFFPYRFEKIIFEPNQQNEMFIVNGDENYQNYFQQYTQETTDHFSSNDQTNMSDLPPINYTPNFEMNGFNNNQHLFPSPQDNYIFSNGINISNIASLSQGFLNSGEDC